MRSIPIILAAILLLVGYPLLAVGQGGYGSYSGDTCWQCPVCDTVYQLTPEELAQVDPYEACPNCYMAIAFYFVQVSCGEDSYGSEYDVPESDGSEYEESESYESEYDESESDGSEYGEPGTLGTYVNDTAPVPQLEGKVLMVVPPEDYQDDEFNVPRDVFVSRGLEVTVASKGTAEALGSEGGKVTVDLEVKDADVSGYEAVVFVGGMGVEYKKLYEDADYTDLASRADRAGTVLGAICLAPKILANAGLLDGVNATSSDPDYIKMKGANFVDEDAVTDGYTVTGSGPDASREFADAVVAAIVVRNAAPGTSTALTVPPETGVTAETLTGPEAGATGDGGSAGVSSSDVGDSWVCNQCGYVYDPAAGDPENGIAQGTPFEELPSNWKCPVCGVGKDRFSRL